MPLRLADADGKPIAAVIAFLEARREEKAAPKREVRLTRKPTGIV
jgi:hypothetical protein